MRLWDEQAEYGGGELALFGGEPYRSLLDENVGHSPDEPDSEWWAAYTNPIIQVYDTLVGMMRGNAALSSLVRVGNLRSFSGDDGAVHKDTVSAADLPEIRLTSYGSTPHLQCTSSGSSVTKSFEVLVSTGSLRVDVDLFVVEWELYRALVGWEQTLGALTHGGVKFVKGTRAVSVQDAMLMQAANRNQPGWASLWRCEVDIYVQTSSM